MAEVTSKKIFLRFKRGLQLQGVTYTPSRVVSKTSQTAEVSEKAASVREAEEEPAPRARKMPDQMPAMQIPDGWMPMGGFPMDFRRPESDIDHVEDIGIPSEDIKTAKRPKEIEDKTEIKLSYPLVPRNPKPNETVYAYAVIRYEPAIRSLMYHLLEPKLTDEEKKMIEDVHRDLEERLNIDVSKMGYVETKNILLEEVDKSLNNMGFKIDPGRKDILIYYIERDTLGFGKIDAFMKDPNIEDLSCDGVKVPLYAYYRDPRVGSIRTNTFFEEPEELDGFIVKLSQKCNKSISIAEPLLDGTLTDGSRIQATLGSDISRKGSNFTIRKFSETPLTPTHMLNYKTVSSLQLAYLWLAIDHGKSVLVSGGTATGKTSMLNVLSLFIRPNLKVVSIEDTAEIRLPHEHWVPQVARSAMSVKGAAGEVTLFDLLKASLRQRPDYIILGEVRGKEAFVLFQQMATGHPSLATIHAASVPQLIDRLTTKPIDLPARLLENIDVIVFIKLSRLNERVIRRAVVIAEVVGVKGETPVTRKVFEWEATTDTFKPKEKSAVLKDIAKRAGMTDEEVLDELFRRKAVLEWMQNRGMLDYRDVGNIIRSYYLQPGKTIDLIKNVPTGA